MAKAKDTGKTLWERAMSKLPKEKQEQFSALLNEDAVLETLGESALLREDYSRLADETKKTETEFKTLLESNQTWYADNISRLRQGSEALTTLEKMKAAGLKLEDGGQGGGQQQQQAPTGGLSKEDIEKMNLNTQQQGLSVMTTLTNLSMRHLKEFGDVIDTEEIVKAAQKSGVPLTSAYDSLVATKREERREADITKRIEAAKKEGREQALTQFQATPYSQPSASVLMGKDPGPSTLSGLTKKGETSKGSNAVADAVKTFNSLRTGATN